MKTNKIHVLPTPPRARLARNGVSHPMGKLHGEIRAQVPVPVEEGARELHALVGGSYAEAVRDLVTEALFGCIETLPPPARGGPRRRNDGDLDAAVNALAFIAGMGRDEYIRHVLTLHVFGRLHVARMAGRRGERYGTKDGE